jgi:hypothetical protein
MEAVVEARGLARRDREPRIIAYPIEFVTLGQTLEPKVTIVSSMVPHSGANGLMMIPSMPARASATT